MAMVSGMCSQAPAYNLHIQILSDDGFSRGAHAKALDAMTHRTMKSTQP
jgi:hypothetical protein